MVHCLCKSAISVDAIAQASVFALRLGKNWHGVCVGAVSEGLSGWGQRMQPGAIWIIYTLMFGYPVPTHDEHEFTNQAACEIHKHSYSEQIVEAFKLVCSRK